MAQHEVQVADQRHLPAVPLGPTPALLAPLEPTNRQHPGKLRSPLASWKAATASLRRRSSRIVPGLERLLAQEVSHGRLFLTIPVLLGVGILLWFSLPDEPPALIGWLAVPLLLCARYAAGHGRIGTSLAAAALGFMIAGMGLAALESRRQTVQVLDSAVTTRIEGVVERREAAGPGRWRYTVRLTGTADPKLNRPPDRVTLLARGQEEGVAPGSIIAGRARLSPPSGPALPGLTDFGFSAFFDGTGAVGYFYGKPQAGGMAADPGLPQKLEMALYALRGSVGDRIRSFVAGDAGAFAAAIVTDERRAISADVVTALRTAGLAHIVAISGLNMALAAGICFVGLRILLSLWPSLAQALPTKKIAAAGALALVTLYYGISGFGVSAERAYLMMAIMLTAVFFDRPSISLHNIALAAIAIMILSPSAVLGPSFQMSFAVTAALVAGYAGWTARRARRDREGLLHPSGAATRGAAAVWALISGTFMTSLIGGLSTAIFSASHFHQLTSYGLVANLAAMPVISLVVMPAGLLGMLAMPFGLDQPFFALMGLGSGLVIAIATEVATWGGNLDVGRLPPWFMAVSTVGLLTLVLMRTRLAMLGAGILAFSLFGAVLSRSGTQIPDLLISEDGALVASLDGRAAAVNRTHPAAFVYDQWQSALRIEQTYPPARQDPPPEGASGGRRTLATSTLPAPIDGEPVRPAPERSPVDPPDNPRAQKHPPLTRTEVAALRKQMGEVLVGAEAGRFVCLGPKLCLLRSREGVRVAWVEDPRHAGPACDAADLVIAPRTRFDDCRSAAILLNGNSLRRTGSVEIAFSGSRNPTHWRLRTAVAEVRRPWTLHRNYDWRTRTMDGHLPERLARLVSGSGE